MCVLHIDDMQAKKRETVEHRFAFYNRFGLFFADDRQLDTDIHIAVQVQVDVIFTRHTNGSGR